MAEREPKISDATKAADRADAQAAHEPDRMPTAEESARADQLEVDPDAAAHYEEMADRGAKQRGEGRIEG